MSIEETLLEFEGQLKRPDEPVTRDALLRSADALLSEPDAAQAMASAAVGFRICQSLYKQARSFDGLPIALAAFQRASDIGPPAFQHQAANVCGVLSADTADFASAIEFYGRALDILAEEGNIIGVSRAWNNIGCALSGVGRYELASESFRHALDRIEAFDAPQFSRYSALTNLASSCFHLNEIDRGLAYSYLALDELHAGFPAGAVDAFSQVLFHRNLVRLLVAQGDLAKAEEHARIARDLSKEDGGIRASIAATTAQAVIEISRGQIDIAATRLDRCLEAARPIRGAFRDMLAFMVRADEAAGNPARALERLSELSELVHNHTAQTATGHLALSDWRRAITALSFSPAMQSTETRLVKTRRAATAPAIWPTLVRLAMGHSLQIDPSAAHGTRVGALSRLLALSTGIGPLRALEIGLAAQIHDIGLAVDHENLIGRASGASKTSSAEDDPAHCDAGWKILSDDSHPRVLLAREIAKYHHASWNGTGYPAGISGNSIPIHARICAVADVYDTLMHEGSGAPATIASSLERLRTYSGTRLDPDLVDRFVGALQDETRNEGIELDSGQGLHCFHQLIKSLSSGQRYL